MKIILGFFIFSSTLSAYAGSSNGVLLLRARVPASSSIKVEWNGNKPTSRIITNGHSKNGLPKVMIEKKTAYYLVSVTHP